MSIKSLGQITVSIPDTSQSEGKRITIPIIVDNLSEYSIRKYSFRLLYDSNILKAKRVRDSGTLTDRYSWDYEKDFEEGSIEIKADGWLPLDGSGSLINIVFEVIGDEGFSSLYFDFFEFNNGSPSAEVMEGEFWVLNYQEIEFKIIGNGEGKVRVDETIYEFPFDLDLIKGKTYEIEGIASEGSEFIEWSGDINSQDNPLIYLVEDDQKVECLFEINRIDVNVVVTPSEAGNVSGTGKFRTGDNVSLEVNVNNGWDFLGLFVGGNLITEELNYTFIVSNDILFEAKFEKIIYSLNVEIDPSEGGSASGGGYYYYHDVALLEANSTVGWEFNNWTLNGTELSSNSNTQFMVENNTNLIANFERSLYSVSLSSNPSNAGLTSGGGYYYYNQSTTINAHPNEGWVFDYWSDSDSIYSYDSLVTLSVFEEKSLIAIFSSVTAVDDNQDNHITWTMSDPYPNPFNPSSKFRFSVVKPAVVSIIIFDISGQIISKLVDNENFSPGIHERTFEARNLVSGVYFYNYIITESLTSNVISKNGKLLLLK